ncbi:MAG: FAD-dependent oxidoreductase [Clostridia bacterium]|nr:FAD-dependent oxidoreductase [Clostridia bacterium]
MYDIVIIGAGPAGLTAALYARRAEKSVLVLERETFGGQITHSPKVENYPGIAQMSGNEFADKLVEQVISHGADIELDEALAVVKDGDVLTVEGKEGTYLCRSVIIATGSRHRPLGVEYEDNYVGNGISYCAVCDGAFYAGKSVAVVGGGNTALQEAVMLSDICEKVYIVQNLPHLTGESRLYEILRKRNNVEIICNHLVDKIAGEGSVDGIIIKDAESGTRTRLDVDGIFVAIGQIPENEAFANVAELTERGYIDAGEDCLTKTPGVFVAGDCRSKTIRQITTACGDGAVAATAACRFLES